MVGSGRLYPEGNVLQRSRYYEGRASLAFIVNKEAPVYGAFFVYIHPPMAFIYMPYVYILKSQSLNSFYTGSTLYHPKLRLKQHNNSFYQNAYTSKGKPWSLFFYFKCDTISQARRIEA